MSCTVAYGVGGSNTCQGTWVASVRSSVKNGVSMCVEAFSVPSAARSSECGSAVMFVAGGSEVRASTLRQDPVTGDAEVGQVAVWFAVPVARDVLLAAWMTGGLASVGREGLDEMSDDCVREHAVLSLIMAGTVAAQRVVESEVFASGYRGAGAEIAEYAAAVATRLDNVFYAPAMPDGAT
ncbi:MAG: hypothetical protein ACRCYQ_07285 [Nocardioides sp.]